MPCPSTKSLSELFPERGASETGTIQINEPERENFVTVFEVLVLLCAIWHIR